MIVYESNNIIIVHGDKSGSLRWQTFIFNCQNPSTSENPMSGQCFEQFRIALGVAEEAEECQVNTLLYCLGDDAEDILHSTNISEEDRKKYGKASTSFFRCGRTLLLKERDLILDTSKKVKPPNSISLHCTV